MKRQQKAKRRRTVLYRTVNSLFPATARVSGKFTEFEIAPKCRHFTSLSRTRSKMPQLVHSSVCFSHFFFFLSIVLQETCCDRGCFLFHDCQQKENTSVSVMRYHFHRAFNLPFEEAETCVSAEKSPETVSFRGNLFFLLPVG